MGSVRVGMSCEDGHFNYFGDLYEPVKDKDLDKLAERSATPTSCEECGGGVGLAHVEGQDRESGQLARRNGKNVSAGINASRHADRPREGPLTPSEWKRRVFARQTPKGSSNALCAVTGEPLDFSRDDCHHALEKRLLRAQGLYDRVWDERNGVFVKARIHSGQTSGLSRIPREKLPDCVWEFAREIGPWAVARVESDHPPEGGSA